LEDFAVMEELDNPIVSKLCNKCNRSLLLTTEFFHKSSKEKSGFKTHCKECRNKDKTKWRNENKDKVNLQAKGYYADNTEKLKKYVQDNSEHLKEYHKQYRKEHKVEISENKKSYRRENHKKVREQERRSYLKNFDKKSEYGRHYYIRNKGKNAEKNKIYQKDYRVRNRTKINKRSKEWRIDNRERINERERKQRISDAQYKAKLVLRDCTKRLLNGTSKPDHTMELVGCTVKQFLEHIEKQFYFNPVTGEPMTFDNHGSTGWHYDHIIPLSSFDLTNEEELRKANHYTNFQPLWWFHNLAKGSKTPEEFVIEKEFQNPEEDLD
jgi:hypothetical protein